MKVSVQAVAGAIRATKGVTVSKRYTHAGARSVRSAGAYAEQSGFYDAETKTMREAIKIGYWTSGYKHHADRAETELASVFETLKARGIEVVTRTEPWMPRSEIMQTNYYVIA